MRDGTVTANTVAAAAGVSQSAVSRFFTPGASVSARTVAKIRKAVEELGYRPNLLARAMVSGRSRMIGLVVSHLDNYFYPDALQKLSGALKNKGYHILIFMASQAEEDLDEIVQEILAYQVEAIVAASVTLSSGLTDRCREAGIPIVLFNRTQSDVQVCSVTSDNQAGGEKVAQFLAEGGHKKIAYLAGLAEASTQRDRERGFTRGLAKAGLSLFKRDVGDFSREAAAQATRRLFAQNKRPDALFVANDHMAFAAMDVLRGEFRLRIPEDVSVVGYDDVPISAWDAYQLTTVRQPARRMVAATVTMLMESVKQKGIPPQSVKIEGQLIVRASARKPNQ